MQTHINGSTFSHGKLFTMDLLEWRFLMAYNRTSSSLKLTLNMTMRMVPVTCNTELRPVAFLCNSTFFFAPF
ncbi:unnamed protein product, partial [Heterosigma akashiwo]